MSALASLSAEAEQVVRGMLETKKQNARDAADAIAASELAALKAHDRDPKVIRAARAEMEKADAVVAKVQAQLATARAARDDAYVIHNRMQNEHNREFVRLRKAAVAPWRLERAIARLEAAYEEFRADRSKWPVSEKVLPSLFKAQNWLRGLREGCDDPPDDLDAFVDDVLRVLSESTETALQEHEVRVKQVEKERRTLRLFNP